MFESYIFRGDNREKSVLECRNSSLKLHNEEDLIQQSIKSFRALFGVSPRVFLLISFLVTTDFNFES